ncbi:DUF5719 family protein [Terrabacter sp. NPDC080008]|uniref:DUF5719 family protein n=1 Tax=Terrabacter sp. NPDC080008 TaxID=3155176 RepID=UPI00344B4547
MSNVTGILRASVVALAAAGLAVGATRVGGSLQLAAASGRAGLPEASSVLVDQSTLVCPGQQRLGATGLRDVKGTVTVGAASAAAGVVAGAPSGATGTVQLLGGPSSRGLGQTSDRGSVVSAASSTADPVFARAGGGLAPGLVATQVWRHTGDDDRGLAVTPCQLPSSDVWLVGGGGGASRTERVIVTNPGANAVTVSFDVLGRAGRIDAAAGRTMSIAPLSREVLSLDAVAPDEPSPVVHVTATGGVVAAVLDEQWIDGATGRGIDDATRAAAPGKDLVVPAVETGGAVWLRLANPGDTEALAQVRLLTDKGAVQPDNLRAVRVPAGSTVDVSVPGNAAPMGVGIRSDQALVAAAWTERRAATADRMGDFAWTPATPAIRNVAGVVLPALGGTTKRLLLTAGPAPATVQVRLGSGDAARVSTVSVAADSTAVVDAGDADSVWVVPGTGSGAVRGAVSVSGVDGGVPFLSVASLSEAPVRAQSVPVRQVRN